MKNKDRYMLSKLDFIKISEGTDTRIEIFYLYRTPCVLCSLRVPFDETPYSTFMRWLEAEEYGHSDSHSRNGAV